MRPFEVGRRGWLFTDTPKGAEASSIAYSIIETAKANNTNVFQYLAYLLINLPNTNLKSILNYYNITFHGQIVYQRFAV